MLSILSFFAGIAIQATRGTPTDFSLLHRYALDKEMAAKLRKANPEAFQNILKRMLEANGRGFWDPEQEVRCCGACLRGHKVTRKCSVCVKTETFSDC